MFYFICLIFLFSSISCQSNPENNVPRPLQNFRELLPANMLPEIENLTPNAGQRRGSLRQATENIQTLIPDGPPGIQRLITDGQALSGGNFGGINTSPINQANFGAQILPQGLELSRALNNFPNFRRDGQDQVAGGAPILTATNQNVLPSNLRNNFDFQQWENPLDRRILNQQLLPLAQRQRNRFNLAENNVQRPPFHQGWENNIPRDLSFRPVFHGPFSSPHTAHQRIYFNQRRFQQRKKKQVKPISTPKPRPSTTSRPPTTTKKNKVYVPKYFASESLKKDIKKYRNSKNHYQKGYKELTKSSNKYRVSKLYDKDGKDGFSKYIRPSLRKRQKSRKSHSRKLRQNKLNQRNQRRIQRRKNSSSSGDSSDDSSDSGSSEDSSRKSRRGRRRGRRQRKFNRNSSSDD